MYETFKNSGVQREMTPLRPSAKKDIINPDKKKSKKSSETLTLKRLAGCIRRSMLCSDKRDALVTSDAGQGYRTMKAKLGSKKVRPWKWMLFINLAPKDGAIFFYWRRAVEEGKDYLFARFNKIVKAPVYSEQDYQLYLHDDAWTKAETVYLFDLRSRFDLCFVVIQNQYDHQQFKKLSVEDLLLIFSEESQETITGHQSWWYGVNRAVTLDWADCFLTSS